MCGRYTQDYTWEEVHQAMNLLGPAPNLRPHWNVAPTQEAAVVRLDAEGRRVLAMLRWGLVPSWSSDLAIGSRLINARAETVATTPAFRSAFKVKRCLVPVSGFFEWSGPPKQRQPFHIVKQDRSIYALAGLWEMWPKAGPNTEMLETFTIITTEAAGRVRELHDRMPVIVVLADFDRWLAPTTPADELQAIFARASAEGLIAYPVSPRVNSVKNDDASLVEEVAA